MTDGLIPIQIIENKIFVIRGQKVMLDSDLAILYGVETFNLNKAVKRNINRFPKDFMFQLTDEEWKTLRSQIAMSNEENKSLIFHFGISKEKRGGRRFNPYVFTEQGVAMLSSVLKSERAIVVNVQIMRTFVKLREMVLTHAELSKQLKELESTFISYAKQNNADVEEVFRQLAYLHDITKPNQIGFKTEN
jgi:hypothetical protein